MNTAKRTFLAFELDDQRYGLPLEQVERVVRAALPTPLPGGPAIVLGLLDVRGNLAPVINIRRRLGRQERGPVPGDSFIIARSAQRPVVLPADRVRGIVECPVSDLGSERFFKSPLVQGVSQLHDGLLLIHDLERFLTPAEGSQLEVALETAAGGKGGSHA